MSWGWATCVYDLSIPFFQTRGCPLGEDGAGAQGAQLPGVTSGMPGSLG